MLYRSTLQLLRFHFSFFLVPVYLFALGMLPDINIEKAIIVFCILHLLVYPASNGYNSYMDRDNTPIGGVKEPMQPTRQLYWITLVMDAAAVLFSLYINFLFSLGILLYILVSRMYSYRGIRLKKYPVTGFLTVFIMQGGFIFSLVYFFCGGHVSPVPVIPTVISSLLIGALYPLTQIYQHKEDRADGVTTLSYKLGKRGTFIFSLILFSLATFLLFICFNKSYLRLFYLFLMVTFPVVLFFVLWMMRVWRNEDAADFRNSLRMNVIATTCTTIYFSLLILLNH